MYRCVGSFLVSNDTHAAATKQDIHDLLSHLQVTFGDIDERFEKIDERFEALEKKMEEDKQEVKRHFDLVSENIHHDMLRGALNDKVQQHEDRIHAIEHHVGLVAA